MEKGLCVCEVSSNVQGNDKKDTVEHCRTRIRPRHQTLRELARAERLGDQWNDCDRKGGSRQNVGRIVAPKVHAWQADDEKTVKSHDSPERPRNQPKADREGEQNGGVATRKGG